MRDIRWRLERLEQATMPWEDREIVVIFCLSFQCGEVIALEGHGITVNRLPGETEQQLYDRTMIEVKRTPPQPSVDGRGIYMLHEIRENIERPEDWWRADPMGTGTPSLAKQDVQNFEPVAPDPVVTPDPAPRSAAREVVEVGREYTAGIQHWMSS